MIGGATCWREIEASRAAMARARQVRPFAIDAWVVLPEHLHAVWTLPDGDVDFSVRWTLIKRWFLATVPHGEARSALPTSGIMQHPLPVPEHVSYPQITPSALGATVCYSPDVIRRAIMGARPKGVTWVARAANSVATLFPTAWGWALSAVLAAIAGACTAGFKLIENPAVQSSVVLFVAFFWTGIGIFWLTVRRNPIMVSTVLDYRFGLTFQSLSPLFDLHNEEAALQMIISLHNYSPGPLKFTMESISMRIDTRTLPDLEGGFLTIYMSRGAQRLFYSNPFKKDHIKEFFGKGQQGVLSFSVIYGDAEGVASRRLKMSFQTHFVFPQEGDTVNGFPAPLLFNSRIIKESDEEIV